MLKLPETFGKQPQKSTQIQALTREMSIVRNRSICLYRQDFMSSFSKNNLSICDPIRRILFFLFLHFFLERALSMWRFSLAFNLRLIVLHGRSLSYSSSVDSREEFNEVWTYMSFREICNSYICICHIYVSDQSSFLLMLATLNKESLEVIKCKLC